jgi:hypothetical protein
MPALPTLTVTDEQANRMLAAWGSTNAYTEWLKNQIIDFVLNKEAVERQRVWMQQEQAKRDADRTALGG